MSSITGLSPHGHQRAPAIGDALALHQAGRLTEAERLYEAIVQAIPRHFDALHLLGVVRTQLGRFQEAVALIEKALKINSRSADAHYNLGIALAGLGQHDDAVASYRRAIAFNPKNVLAHNNLGVSLQALGRSDEAFAALHRALALDHRCVDAHYNLGRTLAAMGRNDEAIASYRAAIAVKPGYAAAYINLGAALETLHRYPEALESLQHGLSIQPNSAEAWNNFGIVLGAMKREGEAIDSFQRALNINPAFAEAHNNCGNALKTARRYEQAVAAYRQAIALKADYADAWSNLGNVLALLNQYEEAIACYRKALEIRPKFAEAHSYLVFTLDFLPDAGFAGQQAERRRWYECHGARFAASIAPHANARDPDRPLRIGYVSADFRRHSAALSFGPVLRNHDRSQFETVLYSGVIAEDEVTQSFREKASLWRPVATLSDGALADLIRDDRIDILVDLSGHTEGNRLLTFARKPAPVQMTGWGHALGTGVPAIDYFLADPVSVPVEARPLFAEAVIDLPCVTGYDVPVYAPPVAPLPAASGQPVTFGCFNRLSKLTEGSLSLWARLLNAVSGSRLVLKDTQLSDPKEQQRMTEAFAARGVDGSRLLLLPGTPHADHLAAYGRMDIALDPFPTNGGVTTTEALWMGVPVVALLGQSVSGRISAAILSALGLHDWIAKSEDEYLAIAARMAADPAALADLRRKLRPLMQASPVGDPGAYCRAVETAYRRAWRNYCES